MPLGAFRLNSLARRFAAGGAGGRTALNVITYGDTKIDSAQSKFGGSSALFDGSDDYLAVVDATAFGVGTGDFTYETWARTSNASVMQAIFDGRPDGTNGAYPTLFIYNGQFNFYYNDNFRIASSNISNNTWYHVAVVRSSGVITMYVNGTSVGTYSDATSNPGNYSFRIGAGNNGSYDFNGYLDEFRVSSVARYTGNFTPAASAFTNDSDTLLLLHMDGTSGSQVFLDDNSGAGPSSGSSLTSLTNVYWNPTNFYIYGLNYAGQDTSGNPVFAFGYKDDSGNNQVRGILLRINSDGSVTQGTPSTFYTGAGGDDPLEAPIFVTENGGSNYGVMVYMDRAGTYVLYAKAAQMDFDNLTFTSIGSQTTIQTTSLDTFSMGAYLGDSKYALGNRFSGGSFNLVTRSGTSLSVGSGRVTFNNSNVYNTPVGFHPSGALARMTHVNSTASVALQAAQWNGTATVYESSNSTPISGLSSVITTWHVPMDNASRGLVLSSDGTTTKANGYNITWGSSTPTIAVGTEQSLDEDISGNAGYLSRGDKDIAHLIYKNASGTWYERNITLSGTTASIGSKTQINTLGASQGNFGAANYVNVNGYKYLVALMDNTGSNNPDLYVKIFQ